MLNNKVKYLIMYLSILIPNASMALDGIDINSLERINKDNFLNDNNFNSSTKKIEAGLCHVHYSTYKSCYYASNTGDAKKELLIYFGGDGLLLFGGQWAAHWNNSIVIPTQHATVKVAGTDEILFDGILKNFQGLNCSTHKCNVEE